MKKQRIVSVSSEQNSEQIFWINIFYGEGESKQRKAEPNTHTHI